MTDINLLYSIWAQLIQNARSDNLAGVLHCLEMIKHEVEKNEKTNDEG